MLDYRHTGDTGGKLTTIFTHDGSFDVVWCSAPCADGFWISTVHSAGLLVEAVVPAHATKKEILQMFP